MRVLLVDGLNLIRRVYAAVPGDEGTDVHFEGAVTSMGASLGRALERHAPTHAAVVFDGQGASWRRDLYEQYKVSRKPMPSRLLQGLDEVRARFSRYGVSCIEVPHFEADDVIATLASGIASRQLGEVVILSTDKHFAQLVQPGISVFDHFNDRPMDAGWVNARYAVTPSDLATLFALAGDSGVDVPGVRGIGVKTAAKLIQAYGDLDAILAAAGDIGGKNAERLTQDAGAARLAFTLLSLKTDVSVGVNLRDLRYTRPANAG